METIRKLKATWTFESELELSSCITDITDITDEVFAGILVELGSNNYFVTSNVNWEEEGF